jgi:serine/threonine protein kinase
VNATRLNVWRPPPRHINAGSRLTSGVGGFELSAGAGPSSRPTTRTARRIPGVKSPHDQAELVPVDTREVCAKVGLKRFMRSSTADPTRVRALRREGTLLQGRYRIHQLIGLGGMGAVYAGVHRSGHAVAIKVLHEQFAGDARTEGRFRREAVASNTIDHSAVVPVIDDDVSEDGCCFLVMPLLRGETLGARALRRDGRLPLEEVVIVAHALLGALACAHERKIVHRDIKPENVFITVQGEVRVLDFGIARFFERADAGTATQTGHAVGTPAFMAPEQARGRAREVDGRTDLWAVGATLFTLLTGEFVHKADTGSELLILAATQEARRLQDVAPALPTAISAVVDRALAFRREDRWDGARAM